MKPETSPDTLAIPPALLAKVDVAARNDNRPDAQSRALFDAN
jgi:hypothetical protein